MRLRRNALLGAARMIEHIDAIARAHPPDAVGTVGLIESRPNSRNVVPGEVFLASISAIQTKERSTPWKRSCAQRCPRC